MSVPMLAASAIANMETRDKLILAGVGVVVLGVAYFGIVRPTLKTLGVIPDKKAIKNLAQIKDYKGFDPTYHSPSKVTLSADRAKILADQVWNATGWVNDKEDLFLSALTEVGTADNLSYLAKIFSIRHSASLGDHYGYYMDDKTEVERIKDILMTY